jgi:hypothetical protein
MVRARIVHHNNVSGLKILFKSRKQGFFQILDKPFPGCPVLAGCMPFLLSGGWIKGLLLSVVYSTWRDPPPFEMKMPVHKAGQVRIHTALGQNTKS